MPWNQTASQVIMLIEDDPVHARIMRRALAQSSPGDHLVHMSDGESALAALFDESAEPSSAATTAATESSGPSCACLDVAQTTLPRLILLDLRLPATDGFDVLQAIRSHPRTRHIPVIIVSTSERPGDVERCYALGANAYIAKPVDYSLFAERLRSLRAFWLESAELPGQGA